MKNTIARAVHLMSAIVLATSALTSQAANVTLTGWAFGSAGTVSTSGSASTNYNGQAGGFGGTLSGTSSFDTTSFITYCIELEEHFSFGSNAMTGYSVVDGSSYFASRRGNADIADRLGRLMTYVSTNSALVATAAASTSLQLAIWNTVYDTDSLLSTRSGTFSDSSAYRTLAESLMVGANSVQSSLFDVFALEKPGSQDFLLLSARATTPRVDVPEPGSLALVAAALGGLALVRRRGRQA